MSQSLYYCFNIYNHFSLRGIKTTHESSSTVTLIPSPLYYFIQRTWIIHCECQVTENKRIETVFYMFEKFLLTIFRQTNDT